MDGRHYRTCRYCERVLPASAVKEWCGTCHIAYVYGFWAGTLTALVFALCIAAVTLVGAGVSSCGSR